MAGSDGLVEQGDPLDTGGDRGAGGFRYAIADDLTDAQKRAMVAARYVPNKTVIGGGCRSDDENEACPLGIAILVKNPGTMVSPTPTAWEAADALGSHYLNTMTFIVDWDKGRIPDLRVALGMGE